MTVTVNADTKTMEIICGRGVQINTTRKLHVGAWASLGSDKYKDEYLASKVFE